MRQSVFALALLTAAHAAPAAAEPPSLGLPVDCEVGTTCFIQNFFDHDEGPGRTDYACGRLSYDGHDGTDFRTPDDVAMREGVPVIAAAAGTVRAVRDGMDDVRLSRIGEDAVAGREAGNGVLIEHGDGWQTQYSHLLKGSVAVAPGEEVAAGDRLGLVGMSGAAEFPHVEFSVRHNGEDIDPFVGVADEYTCGAPRTPLWSEQAAAVLDYQATGLLVSAFADTAPVPDEARAGAFRLGTSANDPAALVFWADIFGAEAGDQQTITITAPGGSQVVDTSNALEASNVSWFAFAGRRRPPSGWPEGTYIGRYLLERDGTTLIDHTQTIDIAP